MNNLKNIFVGLMLLLATFSCTKDYNSIILDPDAGNSFLDVENDGYVVTLDAEAAPENQNGLWRIYVGNNGRFEDQNDPKTKFYGEPGEKYVLGWEVSEDGQYKSASIDVSFKPLNPLVLSLPGDTTFNNVSLYLEAEAPKFGATGSWSIVGGKGGRIENGESAEAIFIGGEKQAYTLKWSLMYGSKTVSKEFSFVTDVLQAQAGSDTLDIKTNKNETKFFTLEGFLPAGATGAWQILKGEQGQVHTPALGSSLFEGVADTVYTLAWKVNLDEWESIDTVNVRFRGKWGMFTDTRDGQSYRFAEINGLEWMADNFNYSVAPGDSSWYYGHALRSVVIDGHPLETEEEREYYGRLYDWQAAYDNAPEGWRLPKHAEMVELISFLGGEQYAGERIKEGGDTGWELNYPGYYNIASSSDPAGRGEFAEIEKSGLYWLNDYSESNGYASVFEVVSFNNTPGLGGLPIYFFKLPVRYVREVQD